MLGVDSSTCPMRCEVRCLKTADVFSQLSVPEDVLGLSASGCPAMCRLASAASTCSAALAPNQQWGRLVAPRLCLW